MKMVSILICERAERKNKQVKGKHGFTWKTYFLLKIIDNFWHFCKMYEKAGKTNLEEKCKQNARICLKGKLEY